MSAETADNAGTPQSKLLVMENIKEFPRGISDQVISHSASTEANSRRAPGPGLKLGEMDIASSKHQAASTKLQAASALKL